MPNRFGLSKEALKKILIGIGVVIILVAAGITIKDEIMHSLYRGSSGAGGEQTGPCYEGDNIALIKVRGAIGNYVIDPADDPDQLYDPDSASSEEIVAYLKGAEYNDDIKGVILEIDSPGGIPQAAEEIMFALKKMSKPVVAVIRERGLSAAYLVATATDRIYASRLSDVGSIGTTMSYLDASQKNKNEGLIYQSLSSGKFKDAGDSDKELTAEERALLMRDVNKMTNIFIEYVAQNRNMELKEVEKLADGSSQLGEGALAAGLIDEIGDLDSAREWLSNQLEIDSAICAYN